eukprot:2107403-Rhodomonas_salina.4
MRASATFRYIGYRFKGNSGNGLFPLGGRRGAGHDHGGWVVLAGVYKVRCFPLGCYAFPRYGATRLCCYSALGSVYPRRHAPAQGCTASAYAPPTRCPVDSAAEAPSKSSALDAGTRCWRRLRVPCRTAASVETALVRVEGVNVRGRLRKENG